MQLLAQCVFWLAVVLLGSMVAGLVVAQVFSLNKDEEDRDGD